MTPSGLFRVSTADFAIGQLPRITLAAFLFGAALCSTSAEPLGAEVRQLILSVAPDWSSSRGTLQRYERGAAGEWTKVGEIIPVLYGKHGLAWGRGVRGGDELGSLSGFAIEEPCRAKICTGIAASLPARLPKQRCALKTIPISGGFSARSAGLGVCWDKTNAGDKNAWPLQANIPKARQTPGLRKREGDGRTPAGAFALGIIYGNDPRLPEGAEFPYHQVTDTDAWPDDPKNPFYNRHVTVEAANPPAWFASQRMRTGDPAYRWRVEIRHNADPVEPGAGSATFFHIRRGETRPTSGCTTMAEPALRELVIWLRAAAAPHYVVLPRAEYVRLWKAWGLPAPDAVK